MGWKHDAPNGGGDVQLTQNYETFFETIMDGANPPGTTSWLSGQKTTAQSESVPAPDACNATAGDGTNTTTTLLSCSHDPAPTMTPPAADWAPPRSTPPFALDDLSSSGLKGKPGGKMVDPAAAALTPTSTTTTTTKAKANKGGTPVNNNNNPWLLPGRSFPLEAPATNVAIDALPPPDGGPSTPGTAVDAGIGVGAAIGGVVLAVVGAISLMMLHWKKTHKEKKKHAAAAAAHDASKEQGTDAPDSTPVLYTKAELPTGPDVERERERQHDAGAAELDASAKRRRQELAGGGQDMIFELQGQTHGELPAELPGNQSAVEMPG
ncbi:hypothetical protein ACEQ8H_001956 [Pleosporales sp. CAS-2024a]